VDAGVQQDGSADHLDEEGCEHMTEGPFVEVTATAVQAQAPAIASDHHAYRVALQADQAGYVKYAASTVGDRAFFLSSNVLFAVEDDQGKPVPIEESLTSIAACDVVRAKHTVPLPSVGTYFIRLGPDEATAQVTIIVEEAGAHHD